MGFGLSDVAAGVGLASTGGLTDFRGGGLLGSLSGGIEDPDLSQADKAVKKGIKSMKKSFKQFQRKGKSFVDAGFDANEFIQDPQGHLDTFRNNAISAGIESRAKKLGGTSAKAVSALQTRATSKQAAVQEQEQFAKGLQNAQLGQQLLARSQQVDPTALRLGGLSAQGQIQAGALQAQNVQQAALIQGIGNIGLTTALNQGNFGFGQSTAASPIVQTGFQAGPPGIGSVSSGNTGLSQLANPNSGSFFVAGRPGIGIDQQF